MTRVCRHCLGLWDLLGSLKDPLSSLVLATPNEILHKEIHRKESISAVLEFPPSLDRCRACIFRHPALRHIQWGSSVFDNIASCSPLVMDAKYIYHLIVSRSSTYIHT